MAKKNVVLMDGAVGTSLWEKSEDKVPVWRYNLEKPEIVSELHHEYIAAGSKIILANTFGANGTAVSKSSSYTVKNVVSTGVKLAKAAAAGTDVKVALAIGPLMGLLEPYGDISEANAVKLFEEQIGSGMDEKPDLIYLQTFIDIEMLKIAAKIARQYDVPLFCSMSFEKKGRTIMGNSVRQMLDELEVYHPDAVGLNCSLGPDLAMPVIKQFTEMTERPVLFKPNAGKPIGSGNSSAASFDVETFVNDILPAVDLGISYIGGCCGSNARYIKRLDEKLKEMA